MEIRVGVLTISDRSYRAERLDLSGPTLIEAIQKQGWIVAASAIVADDLEQIILRLTKWSDKEDLDLILTTGGTGFSPRDVTPEATIAVIQRMTPGICEVMRQESRKITPHAMLSRAVAGIRNRTLIINLPGSPKGAMENLSFVLPVLDHAIELIKDNPAAEAGHHKIH